MDHRTERISEAIREEIGELIEYEMSDPRIDGVVVTDVQVAPDKRRAIVRIAVTTSPDAKPALAALEHGKSYLKRELAKRLDMYRIPDLHFEADSTAMLGDRLPHLLRRIKKGRPRDAETDASKKAVE
ncbi:MAG: 30S ribosome-binding factor RbfA [Acidobacteriaceae bacterium]|nr:30S ribosome-binding factor RbfA [Acidobacteriaceae bacterium]